MALEIGHPFKSGLQSETEVNFHNSSKAGVFPEMRECWKSVSFEDSVTGWIAIGNICIGECAIYQPRSWPPEGGINESSS
jgi:hypothetical protein